MEAFPPKPRKERERAEAALRADNYRKILQSGEPGWVPEPASAFLQPLNYRSLPDRGLNHEAGRQARHVQELVLFTPLLFAQTLPRKRFLGPALFAGFHVEAMLLDFLDDVFLLHLALKTPQGIFQ